MVGTRRGSLGISVLAEPRTPSRIYESGPLFIECWFMNGYRLHLLCRPVCHDDAKEKPIQ